jgi:hypothetical protein
MARPEPLSPVGAPVDAAGAALAAGAGSALPGSSPAPPAANPPSEAEQFFAPAVLQAGTYVPPPDSRASWTETSSAAGRAGSDNRKWIVAGIALFVVAAVATAYLTFGPGAHKHLAPVALAPKAPTAGLPTTLGDIVRIEAESSRRNALQAVEQVGSGNVGQLASAQPNYTYIGGNQASTDPHTVSVAQNGSTVTIAVSGSNKDICAYGQWAPNTTPIYVTMAHEPSCSAVTAPTSNWSTEPGGAASDLPDDNVG